ncbi:Hexuronate transporter [Acidisarcina polymorpha]|uniref:Hexuronate transporter n=2 Tax=Acidisarcina polymorpha TaxID=2211140 RepID=A0A2Z5G0N6_9BACT|nr:Hexuronate transporter [Acidisarcina polymorpha]
MLLTITIINFIDRQTVSVLAPVLRQLLHLSNEQYGRIVSAFQLGMTAGEFPMGWLMDRWGVRVGLAGAVLWWSAATGTQSMTRSGLQLGLTRFWMGTGECGNYSGGMKAIFRLFAPGERTLAIGIFNSGSMVGATIAPPLVIFLAQRYGFRTAFLVPALLGIFWTPFWLYLYRDVASKRPTLTVTTSLRTLLTRSSAWGVMLCRFFIGPVMQFYWYWIPSYLYSVRHLSLAQIGLLGWVPFLLGDTGGIAGGWVAGWLQKRGLSIYSVRRITMYSSATLCLASLGVPYLTNTAAAFFAIGIAVMADNFLSANMFGAVTDLFPDHAVGRATGLTGVAGGLSGLLFPLLTGHLVDHVSYAPVFVMVGFMPLIGTALLFLIGREYRSLQ